MGCDEHAYIEVKEDWGNGPHWACFAENINLGRNYHLYALLAGVRNHIGATAPYHGRGFPADADWPIADAYSLWVVPDGTTAGEGECTATEAAKYLKYGSRWLDEEHTRISHPDWHSCTWLTTAELQEVADAYQKAYDPNEIRTLYAAIAAMRALDGDTPGRSRLVVWFDN